MSVLGPFGYQAGWNAKCGPYEIPENGVVDAQNVELVAGHYSRMRGNYKWTNAALSGTNPILGMAYFQSKLVAYSNNKIGYASGTTIGGGWTDITGTAFAPTLNVWMTALNNILVIGGFGASPVKWTGTGTTSALGGSPPAGVTCGTTANNYLFVGNSTANPARLQWSAIKDPETWPGANFVDVILEDVASEPYGIQALFPFGEDVLVFKFNSVSRFYTNQLTASLGPLITVNDKYGCAGPQCVDKLSDGRVAFIGNNYHVYIYDGNTFEDISDPPFPQSNIQPILTNLWNTTLGFKHGFLKVYEARNQIWISYPFSYTSPFGTAYSAAIFIYDIENRCWVSCYPDHGVYKAVTYFNAGVYFITAGGDGFLYQEDTGSSTNNNTLRISSFPDEAFFTKSFPLGADNTKFIPRSTYFPISCGNLNAAVYYGSNGYITPPTSVTISITSSAQERKKVIPMTTKSGVWNTTQIKFDNRNPQAFSVAPIYISDEVESQ